jgi:superfamily I DNA/RNA helicase
MPITPAQQQQAQTLQHNAAHDQNSQVRLVAGPGTGKSFSIEERVYSLLEAGVPPGSICVLSFTRASVRDLRDRIYSYCTQRQQPAVVHVRVSTLHSLALRTLRAANLLQFYPADPLVLDQWELENIFDAEYRDTHGIGKNRAEEIRRDHEALWSTGTHNPPNYIAPDPAISLQERADFTAFHGPHTQCYSCVLPGEIVRACLEHINTNGLDPVQLLHIQHLIVDEFQDLNPMDVEFVDRLVQRGAVTFIAGDDDQSIYAFRYASPVGIRSFLTKYPNSGQHTLVGCFRCAASMVDAANSLIASNSTADRIPKQLEALYATAAPPVIGRVHRWRFYREINEAQAIARSCRDLLAAGLNPRDILILLSNQNRLLPPIRTALDNLNVPYESSAEGAFIDDKAGRLVLAALRITCNMHDYVAHRTILGLRTRVGISSCNQITTAVLQNNLNYRDIFYNQLPAGVFNGRLTNILQAARDSCALIATWLAGDTIDQRRTDIGDLLNGAIGIEARTAWDAFQTNLPGQMTLEELQDYLWSNTDEQQEDILTNVFTRLGMPIPPAGVLPQRIRVMTMHNAKGLSARVVFIPGLEQNTFPGTRRQPYPGLVMEAARMLYVSVTRARAAAIISYSQNRVLFGQWQNQSPSIFTTQMNGAFVQRTEGLSAAEIQEILAFCAVL